MQISYKKQLAMSFAQAVQKTRAVLAAEGFGVITEIDARATFKNKLDIEFENYLILGACHAPSAHAVLSSDKELGLLLPCNVLVYEDQGKVWVSAVRPAALIGMLNKPDLAEVAQKVEQGLKKTIEKIG